MKGNEQGCPAVPPSKARIFSSMHIPQLSPSTSNDPDFLAVGHQASLFVAEIKSSINIYFIDLKKYLDECGSHFVKSDSLSYYPDTKFSKEVKSYFLILALL